MDKLIYFYEAFKQEKPIEAQIFNNVFIGFEEKFYQNKPYRLAMANFKKWMKIAAENRGHELCILPVNKKENLIHGIRNIWSIRYLDQSKNL